jgi:hypothetical protein
MAGHSSNLKPATSLFTRGLSRATRRRMAGSDSRAIAAARSWTLVGLQAILARFHVRPEQPRERHGGDLT